MILFVCFIENILQYRIATRPANQGNQLFTLFRGVLIVMTTMKIEETSCGDYPLFVRQSISPPKWEWHDFFGSYPSYNILQSADNITQFCFDYFFVLVIEWVRRTLNERSKSSNNKRTQNKPSFTACICLANTFSDDNTSGMGNGCFAKDSSSNWYSGGRRSKSSGMISRSSYDCLSHRFSACEDQKRQYNKAMKWCNRSLPWLCALNYGHIISHRSKLAISITSWAFRPLHYYTSLEFLALVVAIGQTKEKLQYPRLQYSGALFLHMLASAS